MKLGKTSGLAAVGAWSARAEIAGLIEAGVPAEEILLAIRSGSEGEAPLDCSNLEDRITRDGERSSPVGDSPLDETPHTSVARARVEREAPSSQTSTPKWSSDRSAGPSPIWASSSAGAGLNFAKKSNPPFAKAPQVEVKREAQERTEPGIVVPETSPSDVADALLSSGLFGSFSKKASIPTSDAPPPKHTPYVPKALPSRTRPVEMAKLEEYRRLTREVFEELVCLSVKMDLVDTVAKDGIIDDDLFHKFTDPRSAGTGLRYARLLSSFVKAFNEKHGQALQDAPEVFGIESVQRYLTQRIAEDCGFRTPQSFLYAVEFFSHSFGFFAPGATHPRIRRMSRDYAAKAPERSPAPHFEVNFLFWLEKAVLNPDLDMATRVTCGKLRLCSQASIRHSDLAGTALKDVEWCRLIGGKVVLGLRAKASHTKSGPRTWAASLLGVHPDNDNWLTTWVDLLIEMHGPGWKNHSFVGCATAKTGGWKFEPPLIDEDVLIVKRALLAALEKGESPLDRESILRLRWHGCKSTLPTFMTHFGVSTRTIRFQGAWKNPSEVMVDLYLREAQTLVLRAQMEVLDQIRRGVTIQTLEGQELGQVPAKADWSSVETMFAEGRFPESGGERWASAMDRAVICREKEDGTRILRSDCAKEILAFPEAMRGPSCETEEILQEEIKIEAELMDEAFEKANPQHFDTTPNDVDYGEDSDDSEVPPEEKDMEMFPAFVQLATGTGRVHKPSLENDGVPKCGSHGTRFADLQIGHDWGLSYQLCTKCFGKTVGDEACPLICDYVTEDADGVPTQCGRRCRGDLLEGHLRPTDEGFSRKARHRCALHCELVQEDDL